MKFFNIWRNFLKRCKNMSAAPLAHGVDSLHGGNGISCLSGEGEITVRGNVINVEHKAIRSSVDKGA